MLPRYAQWLCLCKNKFHMKSFTKFSFITCSLLFIVLKPFAQNYFAAQRQGWLEKAEQSKPALLETIKHPQSLVQLVKDTAAFQGWRTVTTNPIDSFYQSSFKNPSGVVVDFGGI